MGKPLLNYEHPLVQQAIRDWEDHQVRPNPLFYGIFMRRVAEQRIREFKIQPGGD